MSNGTSLATVEGKPVAIQAAGRGLVLSDLDTMWRFATIASKSGLAPKDLNTTEKVFVALQWGAELGVGPMQSLKNIAVINGRACMWGALLVALVRRSPLCVELTHRYEGDGESRVCIATGKRSNGNTSEGRFGYKDAKRAELLSKDTYKKYPDRMYLNRARGFVLNDLFTDLLYGMEMREEVEDLEHATIISPTIESGDDAPEDELEAIVDAMEQDSAKDATPNEELNGPSAFESPVYGHADDGSLTPEQQKLAAAQIEIPF